MSSFKYSRLDFLFTCVGLPVFLLDVGLDIWAAVSFYRAGAYWSLGVLVLLLLGSSVLVQVYSWFWYSYEDFRRESRVEARLSQNQLRLVHLLQLGIYLRHAGVLELSVLSCYMKDHNGFVVYLSHDLSMLKIIETFTESAPQLVLMLTIILQEGRLDAFTVLKAVGSASAIAFCVTTYHRSLRSFLPDKQKQRFGSSLVYFLWNLLLIASRLTAIALFASVLACFVFTHFICSWMVFFFFAWRSQTSFMDSAGGEWLYRATVGIIWYFDWFNVTEGRTRYRTLVYHSFMLLDISVLCGIWCWKMITDPPYATVPPLNAAVTAAGVVLVYVLGLLLKMLYYKCCHPNLNKEELKGDDLEYQRALEEDVVDTRMFRMAAVQQEPSPPLPHCNKRMRKLAENFYS
ncbi:XK-related protein 8-like [Amphiprion ocellaris]|uniref:XK-related protein n=1 Tax=Amphiprion ocellaris TaxID=80972 RepID=A0AAQ5YZV5_AMPOC|nr:XK-related protein 8-like [Amphiprion ocellaris]